LAVHAMVYRPDHPKASASGMVYEHVLIAEAALGHYLPSGADIHHVNESPRDNRNRNLVICQDAAHHKLLHARARIVRAGGNPDTQRLCSKCSTLKPLAAFNRFGAGLQRYCRQCQSIAFKAYQAKRAAAA
jgi:hypothetical protein